jgi:hypothetical protein
VRVLALLLFITACSNFKSEPRQGKTIYSYTDVGGTFKLGRETKLIKNKIVTRNQILSTKGSGHRVLEKTILVSQVGSIKSKDARLLTVRPIASEFTVWLEGKKYTSRMKLNTQKKNMQVILESPEAKWQGTSEIKFPSGKYFCFFNQIPECLYHNYFLTKANQQKTRKLDFYVIWDGYPYIQDQFTGVGQRLFAPASLKFEGEFQGYFRYIVEVEGQMILYQFSKSFDLVNISWITQGMTIVPPGQEVVDDE